MGETKNIRRIGTSLGLLLDRRVLEKVYGLVDGSEVDIEYNVSEIIIRPKFGETPV